MNRRNFLESLALAATAVLLPGTHAQGAPPAKLNFVFILADDLGWNDLACYGSRFYETSNLDRLAAQGMRFTQAYAAAPVCSPTRASIQTGRYPARVRLTNFLKGNRPGKLLGADYADRLDPDLLTIPQALARHGYTSFYTGKWHLGAPPQHYGYQVVRCALEGGGGKYFDTFKDSPAGEYLPDRLTTETLKFIDEAGDKPFFAFVGHLSVHVPLQAKPATFEKYRRKAAEAPTTQPRFTPVDGIRTRVVQDNPTYAAMVESLDESVGRIIQKLEERKLADRTVIIFMSDNGGLATAEGLPTANAPLRGGKGWLYEGGIRVPLIIKWPGVTKPGTICQTPVTSTDFFPTILDMAALPAVPDQYPDGVSFAPLLRGQNPPGRAPLFWHYPHYSNQGGGPAGAVRQNDWKLIEFFENMNVELYNLKDDPYETTNIASTHPQEVAALRKLLQDWRAQLNAAMPRPNPHPVDPFPQLRWNLPDSNILKNESKLEEVQIKR